MEGSSYGADSEDSAGHMHELKPAPSCRHTSGRARGRNEARGGRGLGAPMQGICVRRAESPTRADTVRRGCLRRGLMKQAVTGLTR